MAISSFTPSVSGIEAQAQALNTVSTIIANVSTVGYRSVETMFKTLLGHTPSTGNTKVGISSSRVGINGVTAYDRTLITQQGSVSPTGNNFDVALNHPNAFFMVEDSAGNVYYTRAGNFSTRVQDGEVYLVANNGFNVDGFAASGDGFAGTPSKIIINTPDVLPSEPTTQVSIKANVPGSGVDNASYSFQVYGANNDGKLASMQFHKDENESNVWQVTFSMPEGEVIAEPVEVVFDNMGKLVSPRTISIETIADNGDVNNITIDISEMTQYAGNDIVLGVSQDGRPSTSLSRTFINNYGVVQGEYTDGTRVNIAKLAVVGFEAPENLIQYNGTMFEVSNDVGESHYVIGPDTESLDVLTAQAVESSPVNLEAEFSDLIIVQRAYTLNTTSFTTNNEMLQTAVNILS
jgi:flagellar hook protein FlgE